MDIIIKKNKEEVGKFVSNLISNKVKNKSDLVLGLATGSTPESTYEYLIKDYKNNNISYENVTTFNLDEYVGLESTDLRSYCYYMNDKLFDHINIKKENTYVPIGIGNVDANSNEHEELISKKNINLQILGIGTNGHIGFNEPGSSFDSKTRVVDLTESTIKSNSVYFDNEKDVPKQAVSMGIGTILKADEIVLIALGKSKAEAIFKTINNEISEDIPSTALRNHKKVTIVLDEEAASLIK